MKTDFFELVSGLEVAGQLHLTIGGFGAEKLTVTVHLSADTVGDKAARSVPPMVLSGTVQELNEGFFEAIQSPVQETSALFANMEAYTKSLEAARLASKMEQDKKGKAAKATAGSGDDIELPQVNREELRKAYMEKMKSVKELESACKYDEALESLPDVEEYPDKEAEINKRKSELERLAEQKKKLLLL
ncbi:MAG: PRTRC system protein E [Sphingobacteriales bacterium]|nr:MAG: PRTRC system protein E [Sphingobacteriales bacterium]